MDIPTGYIPLTRKDLKAMRPMSLDDYEKFQDDTYNSISGTLEGYDCKLCKNRGSFQKHVNHEIRITPCECMTIRRNLAIIERSGMKKLLEDKSFDNYIVEDEWQGICKNKALRYLNSEDEWFLACGMSGCGKTHLCTAICKHFIQSGREVRYMLWRDILSELRSTKYESKERRNFIDELKKIDILYIDDFMKTSVSGESYEVPPADEIRIAYDVINTRYIVRGKTIISTEFYAAELSKIDSATNGRIKQMCRDHYFSVRREDVKNYRLRKGKK